MDYAIAAIIYLASILGVLVSIYGMITSKNDRKMVNFFLLCSVVFSLTIYLGGSMLNVINNGI